jgi:nucleobase:cation symporter-1, NCS1 family
VLGTFLALIWLGVLGAAMASGSTNADPAELVASLFGVMTIPVLLVIIHGAVAVNIESVYSAPLCMLAGGIKLKRWVGSVVTGIIASGVLIAFLASSTFATSFTNYMNSFVIWTAAWGSIILIDYFIINRGHTDIEALYDDPQTSRYGDIRWPALGALLLGLIAGWAWEYGSASLFQGPLSRATDGVDFSWLAAILASGGAYYVMERTRQSTAMTAAPVEDHARTGIAQP